MALDLTAFSTQERMILEHHTKRQDAIAAEIAALRQYVDALTIAAALKVYKYEQSRLARILRFLRLL